VGGRRIARRLFAFRLFRDIGTLVFGICSGDPCGLTTMASFFFLSEFGDGRAWGSKNISCLVFLVASAAFSFFRGCLGLVFVRWGREGGAVVLVDCLGRILWDSTGWSEVCWGSSGYLVVARFDCWGLGMTV